MSVVRARYALRVIQGNNRNNQVPVFVIASNEVEARQKALALTDVHSPLVVVDRVEEVAGDE